MNSGGLEDGPEHRIVLRLSPLCANSGNLMIGFQGARETQINSKLSSAITRD